MRVELQKNIQGSILDVGGGGEGVIGQIYQDQVVAIDKCQEELDEAPDCCEKRLMDATDLLFENQSFDNATFFYSLMYMTSDARKAAISEAARVLRKGGRIYIWDSDILSADTEAYGVDLDIIWDGNAVHASYGIVNGEIQNSEAIVQILKSNLFSLECCLMTENHFYICGIKE